MITLRAGLSGCGAKGLQIVEQVRTHDHCAIVAVHDPDPRAVHALRERTGIGFGTTSFDELLGSGVDFVVLAGPCGVRRDQVARAAEQGVHCLLLAPMAPDTTAAAAMVAACDAAGVKLGVAVPGQDDPVLDQIRRMIAADWLGGIVLVQGACGEDLLLRTPPRAGDWRLDPALAGVDPLLQLAAAHVHLGAWLSGRRAVQVTAQTTNGFLPLPHDGAIATAVLRGNVSCTFAASHLSAVRTFAIHGTDGGVHLTGDHVWLRGRVPFEGDLFDYLDAGRELSLARSDLQHTLAVHAPQHELVGRFARWLDDRDDFPCPAEQAVLDMNVLAAMARAASTGCAQKL